MVPFSLFSFILIQSNFSFSIRCHLAGSKKIQQILSKEGMIDTFLQSQTEDKESNEKSKKRKDDILALCDTFTGLYSLDLVSSFISF